jgi:hypothetical protein
MGRVILAGIAMLAAACPAIAENPSRPDNYLADVRAWQAHDARLMALAWRLTRANAPFCANTQPSIGLMLTDFHRFARPADVSAALGISTGIAIEAVAPASPAATAGLRAGETLLAINSVPVSATVSGLPKGRYPHDLVHDRIDAELSRSGAVTLRLGRAGEMARDVRLVGQAACRARFTLISSGSAAMSEGYVIRIAAPLMAEHPKDDEAATMLAHELAHNILGHVAENNAKGRNYLTVRRNEREADRLAPWLMANAGFDPAAAPRFIASWGPRHGGGITRSQSHDGWQDRAEAMTEELAAISTARAGHAAGPLDWRARLPAIQRD